MKKVILLSILAAAVAVTFTGTSVSAFSQGASGSSESSSPPPQQGMAVLSGKVIESMNAGNYTYIHIEKDGKRSWVAVPGMNVTVGQEMTFQPGMVMNNFESKSLNRTFESIVFSGGPLQQEKSKPAKTEPKSSVKAKKSKEEPVKVDKASGPNAYTVGELHAKSASLNEKDVVFKGKAVKFSPSIMGKNWVHIQDGSGSSAEGTNDILVTTQDFVSVGDVVTISGKLYKDKDFGSGYKYPVIVEKASLKK